MPAINVLSKNIKKNFKEIFNFYCILHGLVFVIEPSHEKTINFICVIKDADQLCSNCTADQRLSVRHSDSTIPLLL